MNCQNIKHRWLESNQKHQCFLWRTRTALGGATSGATSHLCLILYLARVGGLEPPHMDLESTALPIELYPHKRWWRERDLNPRSSGYEPDELAAAPSRYKTGANKGTRTLTKSLEGSCATIDTMLAYKKSSRPLDSFTHNCVAMSRNPK